MKLHRSPKSIVVGLALTVISASCADVGSADVGMQNLTADVVFGAKQPAGAAPANFASPGAGDAFGDGALQDNAPTTARRPGMGGSTPASPGCPVATVNDFPRAVSNGHITTERPATGQYRWKRSGKYTPADSSIGITVAGFQQRQITEFRDASPDPKNGFVDYTFKTIQPHFGAANVTIVTNWHVRHLASDDPPVTTVRGQQVASTSGGVFLTSTEFRKKTAAGDEVTTFTPGGSGVVYIPLPFNIGVTFKSVGVDPKTFDTLQNEGKVTRKVQVDACGQVIDSYRVEATQTFTSGQKTATQAYNYEIATSMGGVLVMEEIDGTLIDGSKIVATNTIGQVDPSPVTVS